VAARVGVPLFVAIFPELVDLDERYPYRAIHEQIARACAELGIGCIDVLPAWLGRDAPDLWVHPSDHHPNEEAHRLAAERILEAIRPHLPGR
jgi:lysophospholipase L1-like esterase